MPEDDERSRCSSQNVRNQRRQEMEKCGTAEVDCSAADRIMKRTADCAATQEIARKTPRRSMNAGRLKMYAAVEQTSA